MRSRSSPGPAEPPPRDRFHALVCFDRAMASSAVAGGQPASQPPFAHCAERTHQEAPRLAGFDEAGRGAWAGPVVVGCVRFAWSHLLSSEDTVKSTLAEALAWLDDSKRVTVRRRERLFDAITSIANWAVGCASAHEVDRLGIVAAGRLAARRAWQRLRVDADLLLFDRGLSLPSPTSNRQPPGLEITRGDGQSLHIAAASIVAKVSRDALMCRLASRIDTYGWETNKGYGTAAHRAAITCLGPSRFHRRSFLGKN